MVASLRTTDAKIDFSININKLKTLDRGSWWWEEVELVSVDSTDSSVRTESAMDSEDVLHVAWRDDTDIYGAGTDQDILYRSYDTKTSTWSSGEIVSSESDSHGNDPTICTDIEGNIHVAWIDGSDINGAGTDADIFYKMKDHTTGTWTNTEVVSTSSTGNSYLPDLVVDIAGNVHLVWYDSHDYDGVDQDIIYKKRDAISETWSAPIVVSTESTSGSTVPRIAIDSQSNLHVVWQDNTNMYGSGGDTDVFYKKWDVDSWSSGTTISYESPSQSYFADIEIDNWDNIHVVWLDSSDIYGADTDTDIFYTMWDSSSSTWLPLNIISGEIFSSRGYSSLVVEDDSFVHVLWEDQSIYGDSGTDTDIFYRSFDLKTDELSDITVVSEQSTVGSYAPSLTIDSRAHLHAIWYDYEDMLGSGVDADVFHKKFVGTPKIPILAPFIPSTTTPGNHSLSWSSCIGADEYKVYRSNLSVWDKSDLELITTTFGNSYEDELSEVGVYYYAIVASNPFGDSEISNVEYREVVEAELAPGIFDSLDWGEIIIIGGSLAAIQIVLAVIMIFTRSAGKGVISGKKK